MIQIETSAMEAPNSATAAILKPCCACDDGAQDLCIGSSRMLLSDNFGCRRQPEPLEEPAQSILPQPPNCKSRVRCVDFVG